MAAFTVQFLGTSSATPAFGRFLSSQVVKHNEKLFIVDAGEGLQYRILHYKVRVARVEAICISHLHGDHVFGLHGLLTSMSMYGRTDPLYLFGVEGIEDFVKQGLRSTHSYLTYPLHISEVDKLTGKQKLYENEQLEIHAFPLKHGVPTIGFQFQEKEHRAPFLTSAARADSIPVEYYHLLKQGTSVTLMDGRVLEASRYLGAPKPAASYAYCTDTLFAPELAEYISGVDVLYHDSTYLHERLANAKKYHHSTALQAAEMAALLGCKKLYLGHFSARYDDLSPLLAEAQTIFPASFLALDGHFASIDE
jgi:ribonuclease Z